MSYGHYSTKGGMHLVDEVVMTKYAGSRMKVM
jgi:hypothetical protein